MRGRLIFPLLAELAPLDTENTSYDDDFREPVAARAERALVRVPAQFEPGAFESLQQMLSGNAPQTKFVLCFHFRDLEELGLVDASGVAHIHTGDRLAALYDLDGNLVQQVRNPPGMFVTDATPGFAFIGGSRNLLLVTFEQRDQTGRAGGG